MMVSKYDYKMRPKYRGRETLCLRYTENKITNAPERM